MAAKTFNTPAIRSTRQIETKSAADPAFQAAAAAFPVDAPSTASPAEEEVAVRPARVPSEHEASVVPPASSESQPAAAAVDTPANAVPPFSSAATRISTAPASVERDRSESATARSTAAPARRGQSGKMTIYPGVDERRRLAVLRFDHQLAESIVVEYALELLFKDSDDDHIVAELRSRGHGLRRAKAV